MLLILVSTKNKLMKMQQITTKYNDTLETHWVNCDFNLKIGDFVKFKDLKDNKLYEVIEIYDRIVEKKEINRVWDVGGL